MWQLSLSARSYSFSLAALVLSVFRLLRQYLLPFPIKRMSGLLKLCLIGSCYQRRIFWSRDRGAWQRSCPGRSDLCYCWCVSESELVCCDGVHEILRYTGVYHDMDIYEEDLQRVQGSLAKLFSCSLLVPGGNGSGGKLNPAVTAGLFITGFFISHFPFLCL